MINRPPNAQFTSSPNPAKIGETVTFTNYSSDPDGHSMSFEWTIELQNKDGTYKHIESISDGVRVPPYSFTRSFSEEGKYFIKLVATDEYGATGEIVHTLVVWTPLEITGKKLSPNPAQSGVYVTVTIDTDGFAEKVIAEFKDPGPIPELSNQIINLTPKNSTDSKLNTWTGKFRTSPWVKDDYKTPPAGTSIDDVVTIYPVKVTATRSAVTGVTGPQTEEETLYLHIKGSIYHDLQTGISN